MANNIIIKDSSANNTTVKTTETSGIHVPHHNIDNLTDILVSLTNIFTELQAKTEPSDTQTVSIDGTLTVDTGLTPLTDTQLRATPIPVSGDFYQTTQPVSLSSLPSLATGSNTIGAISNTSFNISGTLPAFSSTPTVNIGTSGTVSTAANQIPAFINSPMSLGATNQGVLKNSVGKVYKLYCRNKATSTRYFQIHNKATAPVDAEIPILTFPIAADSALLIDSTFFGASGFDCSTGIAWAFSSTENTLTLATAANQISQVGYL